MDVTTGGGPQHLQGGADKAEVEEGAGSPGRCNRGVFICGAITFLTFLVVTMALAIVHRHTGYVFIFLGTISTVIFLGCCCLKKNPVRVRCELCKQEVPDNEIKEHRAECEKKERARIASLPGYANITCPLCAQVLVLQPERRSGNSFTCQAGNPPCPFRGDEGEQYTFYSSGRNRFSCVGCKFDMCYDCLERRVIGFTKRNQLEQQQQQQQSSQQQQQQQQQQQLVLEPPVEATSPSRTTVVLVEPPPAYDDVIYPTKDG